MRSAILMVIKNWWLFVVGLSSFLVIKMGDGRWPDKKFSCASRQNKKKIVNERAGPPSASTWRRLSFLSLDQRRGGLGVVMAPLSTPCLSPGFSPEVDDGLGESVRLDETVGVDEGVDDGASISSF